MYVFFFLDFYVIKMIEEVLKLCKEIRIFCLGNVNCCMDFKMLFFKVFKRIVLKIVFIFGCYCFL